MPTCFKIRIKKHLLVLVSLMTATATLSQPLHLKPEMDLLTGLQSNAVKVIRKDREQRLWLGTYQGLQILNSNDVYLDSIQKEFRNKAVWGIELYGDLAIVGSQLNGIHIYDLKKHKKVKAFDPAVTGIFWKFKLISDTLFIATKDAPFFMPLKTLALQRIKHAGPEGFFTDFEKWNGRIIATHYTTWNSAIFQLVGDSLLKDNSIPIAKFSPQASAFVLRKKGGQLIIGGNGFNITLDERGNRKEEVLKNSRTGKRLPTWDLGIAEDRVYTITGEPDNTQQGMVHELFTSPANELKNRFYGLSLMYDGEHRSMWAGTENLGLFLWPSINSYYPLPGSREENYRFYRSDNGRHFIFDDVKAYEADIPGGASRLVYEEGKFELTRRGLFDLKAWNDTIAVTSVFGLKLFRNGKEIFQLRHPKTILYNVIEKLGNRLILFSMYDDAIINIDLKTSRYNVSKGSSNQVSTQHYRQGIFYHSTYNGFLFYDTASHPFQPSLPTAESFSLSNDTLFVLDAAGISNYKIDLNNHSLRLIRTSDLRAEFREFAPKWIRTVGGKVYCGNYQGFLLLHSATLEPLRYHYLGNFSELAVPQVFADTLYFKHPNYIAKLAPEDLYADTSSAMTTVSVSPRDNIAEFSPFSVHVNSTDYLTQNRSLKTLMFIHYGDTVIHHALGNKIEIPQGLKRGKYGLVVLINGREVFRNNVRIIIPLTSNPVFYLAILLFIAAIGALWIRNILTKRKYEKQILDNRLQLLKQNLNPHFIFNSLNLIYSLVLQKKNDAAVRSINNFAALHRYYLDNINKPGITLAEELRFINSYLKMESGRREVDQPFSYVIEGDPGNGLEVPPMILQPLVENAVKYCRPDPSFSDTGMIWISYSEQEGNRVVSVENTSSVSPGKIFGKGLGLTLIRERIDIYNRIFNKKLALVEKLPPLHCKNGYRAEITL